MITSNLDSLRIEKQKIMDKKENDQRVKFIKESDEDTNHYILQKNKKTKIGATIIIGMLVLIIGAIVISGVFL